MKALQCQWWTWHSLLVVRQIQTPMVVPTINFLSLCDVSYMVEPPQFQFWNWKLSKLKRVCLMSKVIKTQAMSRVIPVLMWYPFHLIIEDGLNNIHTTTNNKLYSNSQRQSPTPKQSNDLWVNFLYQLNVVYTIILYITFSQTRFYFPICAERKTWESLIFFLSRESYFPQGGHKTTPFVNRTNTRWH